MPFLIFSDHGEGLFSHFNTKKCIGPGSMRKTKMYFLVTGAIFEIIPLSGYTWTGDNHVEFRAI
jgi:hypothetical protein